MTALLTGTAIFVVAGGQVASAAQPPPRTLGVASRYITAPRANTSWAYNSGCSEGTNRARDLSNSEVVLDFGSQVPNANETRLPFHDGFASYSLVESMSENFAKGYFVCTGTDTSTVLKVAVGTTNDNIDGQLTVST